VQEQLKEIHNRVGTAFIYVTHDQEEALTMSDRIVIMNRGKVVQIGSPVELCEKPRTTFAASFLGKSNFIRRDRRIFALRPEEIEAFPAGKGHGSPAVGAVVVRLAQPLDLIVEVEGAPDGRGSRSCLAQRRGIRDPQAVDLCWSR